MAVKDTICVVLEWDGKPRIILSVAIFFNNMKEEEKLLIGN